MGRRRDSVMTSLWLDHTLATEIEHRANTLDLSKAEVIRRMLRWAIATNPAAAEAPRARPDGFVTGQ
ncbi:MAG: hypothetical protein ACM30G_15790 [Micromonosporaceae bacterium]